MVTKNLEAQQVGKEIEYMNVAKAIGIILVVVGHSFAEKSTSSIRSFVYLFHVPLFFIISGYFFNEKYIKDPISLIIKRIKTLLIPFFYWSTIFLIFHNLFFMVYIYSDKIAVFREVVMRKYSTFEILKKFIALFAFKGSEVLLGAFWFLPCLFFTVMIFLVLRIAVSKFFINRVDVFTMFACLLCFIFGNILIACNVNIPVVPYDLRLFLVTTFLYCIGFFYKKYESHVKFNYLLFIASSCMLILVNEINLVKIVSIYSVVGSLKKSLLFLVVTPLLGSYFVLYLAKIICRYRLSIFFNYIGKNTIIILALHFLCFKAVNCIIVVRYNLDLSNIAIFPVISNYESWFVMYSVFGVFIPIIVKFLFDQSKMFFFGKLAQR